ncbi:MAG: hypothetical protein ABIA74_03535 [bacterium]
MGKLEKEGDKLTPLEIKIDLGFTGLGTIYKPINALKYVPDISKINGFVNPATKTEITNAIEKIKNNFFVTFVLKYLILTSSITEEIKVRFENKLVKYDSEDAKILVAYLFARLAQTKVGDKTFFESVDNLDSYFDKLPKLIQLSDGIKKELSSTYKFFRKNTLQANKNNPFIIQKLDSQEIKSDPEYQKNVIRVLIFNIVMAFNENKIKYSEQAKKTEAYKNLVAATEEYTKAKNELKQVAKKTNASETEKRKALSAFNKAKKNKEECEAQYNKLFVDAIYRDGKTIIELLTVAVAELKYAIKDVTIINHLYNQLFPLYMIGIDVMIFYGMIKNVVGKVAEGVGFLYQIKQLPGKAVGAVKGGVQAGIDFIKGGVQRAQEEVAGAAGAAKAEVVGGVKGVTEGIKGSIESAKEGVAGEIKGVKSGIEGAAKGVKAEVGAVTEEVSGTVKGAKESVKSEVGAAAEEVKGVGKDISATAKEAKETVKTETAGIKEEVGGAKKGVTGEFGSAREEIEFAAE